MNNRAARRGVLRMAAGLALLPLLATPAARAHDRGSAGFAPPSGDMIYRRIIERQLPDGNAVRIARDFRVRFAAQDDGNFVVDGGQVGVRVDAPTNLAALARLEEQRVEHGLFPLSLDPAGRILYGADFAMDRAVAQALEEVQRRYASEGGEVSELLDALAASSASLTAHLPNDLFAPVREEVEQREAITLPWGQAGEVRMRFVASCNPETRLMRQASREVVTSLEGEERRSSEHWELFAA